MDFRKFILVSQLQNSISAQIRAFAVRARSRRKLPIASRICPFAPSATLRQNHRICGGKRVLQLALVLALSSSLTSLLFASTERGDRLITEGGGAQGIAGVAGPAGAPGLAGAAGAAGIQGIPGIPGAPGILAFSDFYALQGGPFTDNPSIAAGSAVNFPRNGSSSGGITRTGPSSFNLAVIGTYLVLFQVDVTAADQLMLRLNSGLLANSVVGRATGSSQITGISLVNTTLSNSVLEVINPPGNTAVVIPPSDGGTQPISEHLVIIRIQ